MIKKYLLGIFLTLTLARPLCAQTNALRDGVTVMIDPVVALTNYTTLGDWNTDGNLDGWSAPQVDGAAASGGLLSGSAAGTDPQLTLTGLGANGPDLDLAFNDYLDVRLQVPFGFGGSILVYFGATNNYFGTANTTTGFSGSREVTITNIPTDGNFHVYRIFFGPHVYWRGNLSDVRIDPLGNAATVGDAFAIDYVRVGDLTGDVYLPSYAAGTVPGPGTSDVNGFPVIDMSSKHFRFCWDISVTSNSFWTANMPHGTLRNFEEVWKNHVWRMGFPEPSHPINAAQPYNGQKRKVNITTWNGGYWTGADGNNIPWVNITPDGLRVDDPTWVPPHEFGHGCQESANTNGSQQVDGQFWENHANYVREQWLYHYPWETNQSGLDTYYADTSHFWLGHGRNYYLCWPIWLYLDENPDNLPGLGAPGFGSFFSTRIWEQAKSGEYLWDTLARLAPATSVQDILGYMARRNVMWDYTHRAALTNAYNLGDKDLALRWTYAELRQRADDPTWWQTPIEFAPQQGGYKITRLVPQGSGAGRVVSVNFHGFADSSRGPDWRVSLVVVSDNGAVRYSSLWNAGTNSVTLAANENNLFLSVAGTPNTFLPESIDDSVQPYQSAPSKVRFPYEIQVSGAAPFESTNGSTASLVQVANGGGWRAATATVDATAYVGPNARVLGTAKVRANARIEDYAVVQGNATVTSNAIVSGHALVRDSAVVKDFAKVRDYALVIDNSVVGGNARILQHGEITAGSIITNWATVKGSASTWRDTSVATGPEAWNDAVLDGDFSTAQSVSNGFQFGFEEYNPGPLQWITNRTAPRRLYAAYDFASAHDSLAKDSPGVTDGYLAGNPTWYSGDGQRSGFLAFSGTNQYVILDRSLSDLPEITVTAWIKWSGGAGNQPVWHFGTAATNCMFFTPDDGTGHAKFSVTKGAVSQSLQSAAALPIGVWTHVALSLSNGVTGRLYINGTLADAESITIAPDQLNAPNVNTAAQQNYLARGAGNSLPCFRGALDGVRVYTGPLTDSEIAAFQVPSNFGGVGTLYVDLRASMAANGTPTTFTTWTNLGSFVGNFAKSGSPAYSNNVAGTGIPGVFFNSSARYASGSVSNADILGASDRTMEVWAYNPTIESEETMVSLGDRSGTRKDCALNFGNAAGWGAVTHFNDDVPWGAKGTPSANAWHHLVYTYDGNTNVQIYVDGALWTSDTLAGVLVTPTNDTINIGCQKPAATGVPGQYFSGYINTVRVWGGVMPLSQVASNFAFGPSLAGSGPSSIAFTAISNVSVNPGMSVQVQSVASDPNLPPLPLTFSLVSGPATANIDAATGLFSWQTDLADANTTNAVTIKVQNNATPGLSATRSFTVTVNAIPAPVMSNVSLSNGVFGFQITGSTGMNYTIQSSTNLFDWQTIGMTNPSAMPFQWTDSNAADGSHFYRLLLGP